MLWVGISQNVFDGTSAAILLLQKMGTVGNSQYRLACQNLEMFWGAWVTQQLGV